MSHLFTRLSVLLLTFMLSAVSSYAQATTDAPIHAMSWFESGFETLVLGIRSVLFYPMFSSYIEGGFPLLVLWLVLGGVYFTIVTGCVNIRLLAHAVPVTLGKYTKKDDAGEITHFQALSTSISGTVGLGNIAGVSVAVAIGGPGAVVWMMIAGIFGMATKFAEATMGHKFRHINANGKVTAGAFLYLREGLANMKQAKLGNILAVIFAICCLGGAFGAGNMFQSNQTVNILSNTFLPGMGLEYMIALILAVCVGIVLIGGISRIATVAEKIVPTMAVIYILASITVLVVNASFIPQAISAMFSGAFGGDAVYGGVIGALIMGFKRSAFSNEAGIGSASIVHPAARNSEPVRAGCTALLETFVDTMVICFLTGLVITVTGVYDSGLDPKNGIVMASAAFATVIDWFPYILSICVLFFAFSTMITWSYYGERAWSFLFKGKYIIVYQVMFCVLVFFGGSANNAGLVLEFSDLLLFSMSVPNLIGLFLMTGLLRKEVKSYISRRNSGAFIDKTV